LKLYVGDYLKKLTNTSSTKTFSISLKIVDPCQDLYPISFDHLPTLTLYDEIFYTLPFDLSLAFTRGLNTPSAPVCAPVCTFYWDPSIMFIPPTLPLNQVDCKVKNIIDVSISLKIELVDPSKLPAVGTLKLRVCPATSFDVDPFTYCREAPLSVILKGDVCRYYQIVEDEAMLQLENTFFKEVQPVRFALKDPLTNPDFSFYSVTYTPFTASDGHDDRGSCPIEYTFEYSTDDRNWFLQSELEARCLPYPPKLTARRVSKLLTKLRDTLVDSRTVQTGIDLDKLCYELNRLTLGNDPDPFVLNYKLRSPMQTITMKHITERMQDSIFQRSLCGPW
jgi:hypothetical protein